MHKRRIFLFEGELKTAKGHHLRNLVASSNTYKNHGIIMYDSIYTNSRNCGCGDYGYGYNCGCGYYEGYYY